MPAIDQRPGSVSPSGVEQRWPKARRFFQLLVLPYLLLFLAALLQQHFAGATEMGFGTYPDEPSHYLSGLMVHDYLVSGMKQSPIAYASDYYLHVPMIAIGHWPPGFYLLQALWMMLVGVSRGDMLILIAAITAVLAFSVYRALLDRLGWLAALLVGGIVLAIPIVRWSNNQIMSDTLISVLVFWATLAFGRFLDTEQLRDAVWFGLLASCALLTKPSAGCLAFVPPIAILLTRRFRCLLRPALWLSAAIVVVLCGPWYFATGRLNLYGSSEVPISQSARNAIGLFFSGVGHQLAFLAAFAVLGAAFWFFQKPRVSGKAASLIALPVSVLVISVLSRLDVEPRYLIPAIIPMLALAGYSATWLDFRGRSLAVSPYRNALVCGLCAVAYAAGSQPPASPISSNDGLREMLQLIHQSSGGPSTEVLIAGSSGAADGRIIAGYVERSNKRPSEMLVRVVKLQADSDWNGDRYTLRLKEPDDVISELDRDGISLIAIDSSERWGRRWPHQDILLSALRQNPDRATLIYSSSQSFYQLYRFRAGHAAKVPEVLLKNLKEKVGGLSF